MTGRFGMDQAAPPCAAGDCPVCAICRGRFDIGRAGTGPRSGAVLRYGRGAYFSSVSSKSDDYAYAGAAAGAARVMFLCKVAAGRVFRAPGDSMPEAAVGAALATGPYHSLLGEPGAGCGELGGGGGGGGGGFGPLKFDELVVYTEAAAIPSYLVVYRDRS